MKTAIVNLGTIVSGDWRDPFAKGDAILMEGGKIVSIGTASSLKDYDVVIDADGATAAPGFIDSQVHNTFGDWTPRQKTVGFLESYTHGGTTTAISASAMTPPNRARFAVHQTELPRTQPAMIGGAKARASRASIGRIMLNRHGEVARRPGGMRQRHRADDNVSLDFGEVHM